MSGAQQPKLDWPCDRDTYGGLLFVLPIRTVTESNAKEHWRTRHKRGKAQRDLARLVCSANLKQYLAEKERRLEAMTITLTRIAPRALDIDNLWSSQKHVIDGIADAFGLPDNDPSFEWHADQRRGKPRQYAVEVRIEGRLA